jgi:hypothetical protein
VFDEHTLVNKTDDISACNVPSNSDVFAWFVVPFLITAKSIDVDAFWNVDGVGQIGNVFQRTLNTVENGTHAKK